MINKLERNDLNCNIFSVYDYNGLSMQELLCQFFTRINECIDVSNEALDFLKWLKEIGLKNEVAELINAMLQNGSLADIINHTIFNELNSKLEMNLKDVETMKKNKAERETLVSSIRNTEGFINEILNICQTYTDNFSNLVYGNAYTAYDEIVKPVNGKFELDCSSFINLLIHGVTYYNSRYNNMPNVGSPLFFHNIDSYKFRYSNQIAKYCFDNGYTFYPNSDLSNIRAGDLVFFKWNNLDGTGNSFHDNAFMNIDHVAMYLDRKNESIHQTIQYEQYTPQFLYDVNNQYMNQCVLVARLPFANLNDKNSNNLVVNGNVKKTCTNATFVGEYFLTKKLEKGKLYTITLNSQITTAKSYFIVQDGSGNTIYSDYGRSELSKGTFNFYFIYQGEGTQNIKIYIACNDSAVTQRNGFVNWLSLFEGYKISSYNYQSNSNNNIRELPLNTTIKSVIDSNYAPIYKMIENEGFFSFNINIAVTQAYSSSSIVIGDLGFNISNTTRLPCNLISLEGTSENAWIQFKWNGEISVIKLNGTTNWKYLSASGVVVK